MRVGGDIYPDLFVSFTESVPDLRLAAAPLDEEVDLEIVSCGSKTFR
jgi:hypothetical protein